MKPSNEQVQELAREIVKKLAREGKVIEGGWRAMVLVESLDKVSEVQRSEMRQAYYSGAQHLFSSIMNILEPGQEATEADLGNLDRIYAELEAFVREQKEKHK